MSFLRRLRALFSPARRLFNSTGVRPTGPNSLVVAVNDRSYWVQAQLKPGSPPEYHVWASDIRDITHAPSVAAAPPAPAEANTEVRTRLQTYFARSRVKVTYV